MNFLRSGGTRRIAKVGATVTSLLAFQVLSVIGAGSASAFPAGGCQREASTNTVIVNLDPNDVVEVFVDANGEIRVNANGAEFDCGSATTTNTSLITVLGTDAGNEIVEIENDDAGGLVANANAFGTLDGIPIAVDLGESPGDADTFSWQGSADGDVVILNAGGDDPFTGTANDSTLEVEGADTGAGPVFAPGLVFDLDTGNDYFDGDGSTARMAVNGQGDADVIISGLGPDELRGSSTQGGDPGDAIVYDRTQNVDVSLNSTQNDNDDGALCTNDVTFFGQPFAGLCEGDDVWNFRIVQSGSGNDALLGDAAGFSEAFLPGLGDDVVDGAGEDIVGGAGNQQTVDGDVISYGWVGTLREVAGPCDGPVTYDTASATTASHNLDFPTPNACGTDTWTDVELVAGSNDDLHPQPGNEYGFSTRPGGVFRIVAGDTLDFSQEPSFNVTNGVDVDLENGPITNNLGVGLSFTDVCEPENSILAPCPLIENVIGTEFDDNIDGNVARNILIGLGGDDFFWGDRGNDVLLGLAGNDDFNGGPGADSIWFGNSPNGVTVDASLGFATGEGDDTFDVQAQFDGFDIEIIWGSQFDDNISGGLSGFGSGINFRLIGKAGDDILTGADSNDTLLGGRGNDVLRGGAGLDILRGAQGEDWGFGGAGRDLCRGVEHRRSC